VLSNRVELQKSRQTAQSDAISTELTSFHTAKTQSRHTRDKPTLAAVALLHLKRMAAISAVEDHPIERVNGG
jgi:hypothetical protein